MKNIKLNLLVLGQTGAGKSTLINALVGKNIAEVSVGKPCTSYGLHKYKEQIDEKEIIIYDSWGIEVDRADEWEELIESELEKRSVEKDPKEWFHSVIYCIQAGGLKIQEFDIRIIKKFTKEKYNVVIALTKADQIGEEKEIEFIKRIKKETGIDTVISVGAKPDKLKGQKEAPAPFGLEDFKANILISWEKIFIDRIPIHIVELLKTDIDNAIDDCPNKAKNREELEEKIKNYFNEVATTNLQKYIEEAIYKFYKIGTEINSINIDIDVNNSDNKNIESYFFRTFKETVGDIDFSYIDDAIAGIATTIIMSPLLVVQAIIGAFLDIDLPNEIKKYISEYTHNYKEELSKEENIKKIRRDIFNFLDNIESHKN